MSLMTTEMYYASADEAESGLTMGASGNEFSMGFIDPQTGNGVQVAVLGAAAFKRLLKAIRSQGKSLLDAVEDKPVPSKRGRRK